MLLMRYWKWFATYEVATRFFYKLLLLRAQAQKRLKNKQLLSNLPASSF